MVGMKHDNGGAAGMLGGCNRCKTTCTKHTPSPYNLRHESSFRQLESGAMYTGYDSAFRLRDRPTFSRAVSVTDPSCAGTSFIAAVKLKNEKRIHCLLCVAENAIGPKVAPSLQEKTRTKRKGKGTLQNQMQKITGSRVKKSRV
eukprot:2730466-Rhodomonas_salina.1